MYELAVSPALPHAPASWEGVLPLVILFDQGCKSSRELEMFWPLIIMMGGRRSWLALTRVLDAFSLIFRGEMVNPCLMIGAPPVLFTIDDLHLKIIRFWGFSHPTWLVLVVHIVLGARRSRCALRRV
jgi:hypothetical protein